MPTISWFYGIAIRMYVRDHPPPHVHAIYGEYEAFVAIESGDVLEGALPTATFRVDPPAGELERIQMNEAELNRAPTDSAATACRAPRRHHVRTVPVIPSRFRPGAASSVRSRGAGRPRRATRSGRE